MTKRFVRFHCDVATSGRLHLAPPRCAYAASFVARSLDQQINLRCSASSAQSAAHAFVARYARRNRPGLTLDYGALVLQPNRAFLRLFDFLCLVTPAVAAATSASAAAAPPWYDRWAPTRDAALAAALRAYPPGLKSGRPRPSNDSTGHFEDGLPSDFDKQADRPWELPDAYPTPRPLAGSTPLSCAGSSLTSTPPSRAVGEAWRRGK